MITLPFPFSVSVAVATDTLALRGDTGVGFIERVPATTMSLREAFSDSAYPSPKVLPWRNLLKVIWILAGRIAAQMVGVAAPLRPAPVSEELGNSMRRLRLMKLLHPYMAVAIGVFRRPPRPALIRAALINFRPVSLFEALGDRAFSHGYSVTRWYE